MLASSVLDAAVLTDAVSGYDESDPTSVNLPPLQLAAFLALNKDVKGLRVGVPQEYTTRIYLCMMV